MRITSSLRRAGLLAAAAGAGMAAVIALALPAQAHLPVIFTDADTAAALANSPYVPDGSVSFAFYGWLERAGDTRAVRIHLEAGQQFTTQLLIPDLAPENTLNRRQLPHLGDHRPSRPPATAG